jgi:hypothetical protein
LLLNLVISNVLPSANENNIERIFHISLEYSNLGIIPLRILAILRNSEKSRRDVDEKLQNQILPSFLKINKNRAEYCKICKRLEKSQRSGMVQRKKCNRLNLYKSFPTSIYLQSLASIQPRPSLRKGPKMYALQDPVGDRVSEFFGRRPVHPFFHSGGCDYGCSVRLVNL